MVKPNKIDDKIADRMFSLIKRIAKHGQGCKPQQTVIDSSDFYDIGYEARSIISILEPVDPRVEIAAIAMAGGQKEWASKPEGYARFLEDGNYKEDYRALAKLAVDALAADRFELENGA